MQEQTTVLSKSICLYTVISFMYLPQTIIQIIKYSKGANTFHSTIHFYFKMLNFNFFHYFQSFSNLPLKNMISFRERKWNWTL